MIISVNRSIQNAFKTRISNFFYLKGHYSFIHFKQLCWCVGISLWRYSMLSSSTHAMWFDIQMKRIVYDDMNVTCLNFVCLKGIEKVKEISKYSRDTFSIPKLRSGIHRQSTCSCAKSNTLWTISAAITSFAIQFAFVFCTTAWVKKFVAHACG